MPDFAPAANETAALPEDAPHGGQLVARALRSAGVDTLFALCGRPHPPAPRRVPRGGAAGDRPSPRRLRGPRRRGLRPRHRSRRRGCGDRGRRASRTPSPPSPTRGSGACPLVLCGGHAPLAQAGRGAVQDAPQLAIAATVAKRTLSVYDTAKLPRFTAEAVYRARAGRPGPVYLELPQDVLAGRAAWPAADDSLRLPGGDPDPGGARRRISRPPSLPSSAPSAR